MAITKNKRATVWSASNKHCRYCGLPLQEETFTIDHIRPRSAFQNGREADALENLCACCKTCNTAKAAMTVKEFKKWVHQKNNEIKKLEADQRKLIHQAEQLANRIESKDFEYIRFLRDNISTIM